MHAVALNVQINSYILNYRFHAPQKIYKIIYLNQAQQNCSNLVVLYLVLRLLQHFHCAWSIALDSIRVQLNSQAKCTGIALYPKTIGKIVKLEQLVRPNSIRNGSIPQLGKKKRPEIPVKLWTSRSRPHTSAVPVMSCTI